MNAIPVAAVCRGRGCRKDLMPIGAVVVRKDGPGRSRYVKVNNDWPIHRRWIQYSRWWWEENEGLVPEGMVVVHLNGRRMDDRPANFGLKSVGFNVANRHRRNPEWSREQHLRAAAACGDWNRFAGKIRRLQRAIPGYWYPVVDRLELALDVPFRRRKGLLQAFGADVSGIPKNGHGPAPKRIAQEAGVRPVRGRDLGSLARVNPEFRVGAGRERMSEHLEIRIAQLMGTEIWSRAEAAARLDLSERK